LKYTTIPAITGKQFIRLLLKDGWVEKRRGTHGISLAKKIGYRTVVTDIPDKRASLPKGTLMGLLSRKQTRLGKKGLLKLINKHGLK